MNIEEVKSRIERRHLWINGESAWCRSGQTFNSINPSNGELLSEVDFAGPDDVDEAVQSAASAQKIWWALDPDERGRRLYQVSQIIRQRAEEIALIDTLDSGRPITDTLNKDLPRAAKTFEFFAGIPDKIRGASIQTPGNFLNYTLREPYGVVGAIIPWNYPFSNAVTKVAPAVATGNAVVLKTAEQTPLSAVVLGEIFREAGIPDGLLNVISGDGSTGELITTHPGIGKIAFTGSTAVGRKVLEAARFGIKAYTLELGGKSPNIVFDDANLEQATDAAIFSVFMNQGQTCTAGTRLFVQDPLREKFQQRLIEKARQLRVGDPLDRRTQIGAIVSTEQYDRVRSYIEKGRLEASLLLGGDSPQDDKLRGGYFVNPTIFSNVSNEHTIAREEIFGPVMSVIPFSTEDELLHLANDTDYGLACSIWTSNLARAHRLGREIEAGLVWINTIHTLSPGSPYGGYKQSGIGLEMGTEVVEQFMRSKTVWVGMGDYQSPWSNN